METTIKRGELSHEVCILPSGSKRGIFVPVEVLEWLQDNAIGWTIRDVEEGVTFTIPDETERVLFMIRFAHLREGRS